MYDIIIPAAAVKRIMFRSLRRTMFRVNFYFFLMRHKHRCIVLEMMHKLCNIYICGYTLRGVAVKNRSKTVSIPYESGHDIYNKNERAFYKWLYSYVLTSTLQNGSTAINEIINGFKCVVKVPNDFNLFRAKCKTLTFT